MKLNYWEVFNVSTDTNHLVFVWEPSREDSLEVTSLKIRRISFRIFLACSIPCCLLICAWLNSFPTRIHLWVNLPEDDVTNCILQTHQKTESNGFPFIIFLYLPTLSILAFVTWDQILSLALYVVYLLYILIAMLCWLPSLRGWQHT